jgi:hypothetical protein
MWFVPQMVTSEQSPLSFLPTDAQAQVSPPPPYPTPQELPQPLLQQPHAQEPPTQQPQAAPSLPQSDFQLLTAQVSHWERGGGAYFSLNSSSKPLPPYFPKGSALTSFFPDVRFDQQPMRPSPAFPQQVSGRCCPISFMYKRHPSSLSVVFCSPEGAPCIFPPSVLMWRPMPMPCAGSGLSRGSV